ncbi:uncharacterized protein LOC115210495 [Octopus sinensis]|uniref:Uncharacterized protein LOC115210495 n=1 Tax=Octopus sinensis TaxID=2607531 RepID=A0A6P7S9F9_9MOLL|nr:uncharacterized protein LOC115210495 [Octopus sinensis]
MLQLLKLSGKSEKLFLTNYVAHSITEFKYEPDEGVTFEAYYRRYEQIFDKDCKDWDDKMKKHLIKRKLAVTEHEQYSNYVLPRKSLDIDFNDTIDILCKIFSTIHSKYQHHCRCPGIQVRGKENVQNS